MMDYEDEDEVKIETKPDDFDFTEEHGDVVTYAIQNCYATKRPPTPCKDFKSSTQGVLPITRSATSHLQ